MHKKTILFMVNSMYGGGAEKVLQNIVNHINVNKYNITVCSLHRENINKDVYTGEFNYKVVFDQYTGKNIIKKIFNNLYLKIKGKIFNCCSSKFFYKLFIHEKYDIEIAFIEGESTKIISGSNNKFSKKFAWVHIDLLENPWTDFLYNGIEDEKQHYDKYDKIICVSNATRKAFIDKYKVNEQNVIVHYNPIDTENILNYSKKEEVVLSDKILQIMAVGRLVEQKGFDRLVRVVDRLKNEKIIFKLHIIGDGPQKRELQKYICEHQLDEFVQLHGYLENPYALIKKGDILVCSSRAEGYSLVIAEALVLGLAIVTTNCSGPVELIEGGKYGVLVENSEKGIYEGLSKLLKNNEILKEYKLKSKERKNIFNINENLKGLEELFDE